MIHLFNRAEVLVTYDLAHFNEARDALAAAGIDYRFRTKDLGSPSVFSAGSRSRSGNFGIDQSAQVEYKLYVHRDDRDRAEYLIG